MANHPIPPLPLTVIGLEPDLASTYWLPRLPGGLGYYIGLTGVNLRPDDLMYSGLATHYIPSDRLVVVVGSGW